MQDHTSYCIVAWQAEVYKNNNGLLFMMRRLWRREICQSIQLPSLKYNASGAEL